MGHAASHSRAGLIGMMLLQGRGLADVCSRRRQHRAAVQRGRRLQRVRAGRCERSRGHEVQGRQPCAVLCWRHAGLPVCAGGQQLACAVERRPAEAPRKVYGAYGGHQPFSGTLNLMSWPAASYLQIPARLQAAAVDFSAVGLRHQCMDDLSCEALLSDIQLSNSSAKTSLGVCAATGAGDGVFTGWQACLVGIRGRAQHCSVAPRGPHHQEEPAQLRAALPGRPGSADCILGSSERCTCRCLSGVHGLSVHAKRRWLSRSLHVPLIELHQIPVVGVISLQAKQH